ncbi:unnamed protein product [Peniophora sp. CBMAI 1063]|nr:unnamed protein product [Peniophora sp. CBMAI 1063]
MRLSSVPIAFATCLGAAEGAILDKRNATECSEALQSMSFYDRPFVFPLFYSCTTILGDSIEAKENPWVHKECVAAAVAASIPMLHDGLSCLIGTTDAVALPAASAWPSLDYNVYASIIGSCAWDEGGCPITKQNFIDLIYSTISQEDGPYPKSATILIDRYLKPIFSWTGFDLEDGIPYLNFNDYLHYAPYINHCDTAIQCDT